MLGINIAGANDWNSELPLADLHKFGRAWVSCGPNGAWGKGPPLTLTPDGYPAYLQPGCSAVSPLLTLPAGAYPSGYHVVSHDGSGSVDLTPAKAVPNAWLVDGTSNILSLRVLSTDPTDPVRNVRVSPPGATNGNWNAAFVSRWAKAKCLRFMDLMQTNGSAQVNWADRPTPTQRTWAGAGVPIELLCDLSNRAGVDPWFCIPHLASDDYVTRFFGMLQSCLSPSRTPYIEFSNEVWNAAFPQGKYAYAKATAAGVISAQWYGSQATRCFKLGEPIMAGRSWVRVLSGQQANPGWLKYAIEYQDTASHVDALSCSSYFGTTGEALAPMSPADRLAAANAALESSRAGVRGHFGLSIQWRKRLIGYEGGLGLTSTTPDGLAAATALSLDPGTADLYRAWYAAWVADTGGDLLNHFNGISQWGKAGCWGLSRSVNEVTPRHAAFLGMLAAA